MITLTHVHKVVNQTTLIEIESLTVDAGMVTAVTGLTGQHKTTFWDLLTGQTTPTAGQIRLAGLNPAQSRGQFARRVGLLLAENGVYPRLSARQNLRFFCQLYGITHTRADEVLQQVGLQDQAAVRAGELTPGLARRLAFGRAILHRPAVLLLVEPFWECDQASINLLSRQIEAQAAEGAAILIVTGNIGTVSGLCQQIVVMEQGRLVEQIDPSAPEAHKNLPFKIPARLEGKVALVNPNDILYVTTDDGRTQLCTGNGRIPTHLTLTEVEERLARSGFFRAHRSYLVNLQHVKEVIAYTRDSYTLILDNGRSDDDATTEIPLSKGAARDLREMLDF